MEKSVKVLKRGFLCRPGCVFLRYAPAKADAMCQCGFYEGTLGPLMDKAEDGREALLFLDASRFVMGCDYLGSIYGKVRRFVKSFSGRMRYNVLTVLTDGITECCGYDFNQMVLVK